MTLKVGPTTLQTICYAGSISVFQEHAPPQVPTGITGGIVTQILPGQSTSCLGGEGLAYTMQLIPLRAGTSP